MDDHARTEPDPQAEAPPGPWAVPKEALLREAGRLAVARRLLRPRSFLHPGRLRCGIGLGALFRLSGQPDVLDETFAERPDGAGHFSQLVRPAGTGNLPVEITGHERGHAGIQTLHRRRHAARDQDDGKDKQDHAPEPDCDGGIAQCRHLRLDIFEIGAGADDPAPGLERPDIAELRHHLRIAILAEAVEAVEQRAAAPGRKVDEFPEDLHPGRVLEIDLAGAHHVGIAAMGGDHPVAVEREEIAVAVIAHAVENPPPLGAGRLRRELPGLDPVLDCIQAEHRGIHHVAQMRRLHLHLAALGQRIHGGGQSRDSQQDDKDDRIDPAADAQPERRIHWKLSAISLGACMGRKP
nr:hypothetical protein [Mangrovicoccus ximenensis]